ncbi:STAS domain-containing protein [Streptomyces sp. NPDC020096]
MFRFGTRQQYSERATRRTLRVLPSTPGKVRVSVREQIDDDNADPVGLALAALVEHSPTVIELDLSQLTHVTGPGAGAFCRLLAAANAHHATVTVSGPNAQVRRDLHRTALNRFIVNTDTSPDSVLARKLTPVHKASSQLRTLHGTNYSRKEVRRVEPLGL